MVSPRHGLLPGRYAAANDEQLAPRRRIMEVAYVERPGVVPVRQARIDPHDVQALARVPAARFPSQPAGCERGPALAGRARRSICGCWRSGVDGLSSKMLACNITTSPTRPRPLLPAARSPSSILPTG